MDATQQKIVDEALRLPPAARAALASQLLESLEPDIDAEAEDAWSEEIAKRLREIDSGQVKLIPWAQARRRILGESDDSTRG
ncbi:MAG: addiction module protein [Planctomycetes bacterium]|nr:addiction module protein [Planctomycetota bacterium]